MDQITCAACLSAAVPASVRRSRSVVPRSAIATAVVRAQVTGRVQTKDLVGRLIRPNATATTVHITATAAHAATPVHATMAHQATDTQTSRKLKVDGMLVQECLS